MSVNQPALFYRMLQIIKRRLKANPTPETQKETKDQDQAKGEGFFKMLREPKKWGPVTYDHGAENRITYRLRELGYEVYDYQIDVSDYRRYFNEARYLKDYPDYYSFNIHEKSLEHYLAARLLELDKNDVYIDVASENSPVPEIYRRLFGLKAYRQDLAYPQGLLGDMIGGDAANLPVSEGFATKMALHCSLEHFEGDADIRFVQESVRVLRPGGAFCVVPLYLLEEYAIQTDPEVAAAEEVVFEEDATVYCAAGWGNRHGRFYDPEHLVSRLLNSLVDMSAKIYRFTNYEAVDKSCYSRFAMLVNKSMDP